MSACVQKRPLLLSFAIPTFNFGSFIGETICSILDGAQSLSEEQFEIIILDGGSQDQTEEVVRSLKEQYRNLRYVRHEKRGGIDRDMEAVASLANGNYIWLFSADDILVPGWDVPLIAELSNSGPDVLLVPAMLCDLVMKPLRLNPIFTDCPEVGSVQFHLDGTEEARTAYLGRIATLEGMFSFMSAIVVKRSIWNGLSPREDYFGSCWAHCAKLMPLFFRSSSIAYLNNFIIKKRGGNDSFMEHGFVNRIGIAVEGWDRLIQEFFSGCEKHQQSLYDALRRDIPILLFVYAKITSKNSIEIKRLKNMASRLYSRSDASLLTSLYYIIFRMVPASETANKIISPLLPFVIKVRHKAKSLFQR